VFEIKSKEATSTLDVRSPCWSFPEYRWTKWGEDSLLKIFAATNMSLKGSTTLSRVLSVLHQVLYFIVDRAGFDPLCWLS
jgi:hypothetical protein